MTRNRIPRSLLGGRSSGADAPGEMGGAGRELHSAGSETPGDRTRQAGVGGKLANTDSSLCWVEFNAR